MKCKSGGGLLPSGCKATVISQQRNAMNVLVGRTPKCRERMDAQGRCQHKEPK
jgi:hypothetical protein